MLNAALAKTKNNGGTMASRSFDQLVSSYSPEVRTLARRSRRFIRELIPTIEETVDTSGPYVSYGFGPGYKGVVCYMTISKTGVKLGVANGTSLPDPHRLLQGSGKNVRHVPLSKVDDLEQTGLDDLIRAAHTAWKKRAG
jgi:hypothetical protein